MNNLKLNIKLAAVTAVFIAALMLISPITQINTSGGGGTDYLYNLDFLNSSDINNNDFILSIDSSDSFTDSVSISDVEVVNKKLVRSSDNNEVDSAKTYISISNEEELNKLSTLVNDKTTPFNFSGYTIKLVKNITLKDPDQDGKSNFTPIGDNPKIVDFNYTDEGTFKGTFDGQGYKISNLKINIEYTSIGDITNNIHVGLFGYLWKESTVKNLGLIDSKISATYKSTRGLGYAYLGGIAGYNGGGTITNCYNTGDMTGTAGEDGNAYSGGIVGINYGTIQNCYNIGAVTGTSTAETGSPHSGGIAGINHGTITNSYNTGNVTGTNSGGIAGINHGTITNCYNTGNVTGTNSGGIAGINHGTITNCYNTGNVTGTNSGGIAGGNSGTITNSYNTGNVTASGNSGGIAGGNSGGTITNCYNTGNVTGTNSGGIVGHVYSAGTSDNSVELKITNCYNTGDVTGTNNSGGIVGKIFADSKNQDSFGGSGTGTVIITNCYNTGAVTATGTGSNAGGIAGKIIADRYTTNVHIGGIVKITSCYNTGTVTVTATRTEPESSAGGIAGKIEEYAGSPEDNNKDENKGTVTITNTFYLKSDGLEGVGNSDAAETPQTTALDSNKMKGPNLLTGTDKTSNNLNLDPDNESQELNPKPWSPDIFGLNNGYPVLSQIPTELSLKEKLPPQSSEYLNYSVSNSADSYSYDEGSKQVYNFLKFILVSNGSTVTLKANNVNFVDLTLINPDNVSYQWYKLNQNGSKFEKIQNETSETLTLSSDTSGTYRVEVKYKDTSNNEYSYTSLSRTIYELPKGYHVITFESNEDIRFTPSQQAVKDEETASEPKPDPEKKGYSLSWYSDKELKTQYNLEKTKVTKDMTLYAVWKANTYEAVFDPNGGTGSMENQKFTYDEEQIFSENQFKKSGYIFRGWSEELNGPVNYNDKQSVKNLTDVNNAKVKLYAVWSPIPDPIYSLCLNSNDSDKLTKRYSGLYGSEITLPSAESINWNNGCIFLEWNSKSDGSGVSFKAGDKFSLGSEIWNLYAIWSDSSYHTVSFDSNGGSNVPDQSILDGYRASQPETPTKEGYTFKHWSLNGVKYNFNSVVKEDIVLKAEYEINTYEVTFHYNGEVFKTVRTEFNTSLGSRMPSLPSDMNEWNTNENGKGDNFTSDSLVTKDMSVYAVSSSSGISSALLYGGVAAVAILALLAAWLFVRTKQN